MAKLKSNQAVNKFWDRAWGAVDKLASKKPRPSQAQAFDSAIGKFHTALQNKDMKSFTSMMDQFVKGSKKM